MLSRPIATTSACLVVALVALAASLGAEGRPELALRFKGAQRAVVARVAAVQPRWVENEWGDQLIVSRMVVDVEETLKGVAARRLEVDVEGGTIDGLTMHVSHQPALAAGDRAVLILNEIAPGLQAPHRRGTGVMRVDDSGRIDGIAATLADVRAAARASVAQ